MCSLSLGVPVPKARDRFTEKGSQGTEPELKKMCFRQRQSQRPSGRKPGRMPIPPGSDRSGEGDAEKDPFRKNHH